MLKKRLIYTLLYEQGNYMLSRNFRLQQVGDLAWLRENYNFDAIAFSIDELVVLNVGRGERKMEAFCRDLIELSKNCFLPIAAGGGVRRKDDAYQLLASNVDKVVVNTPLVRDPDLVASLAKTFGSQCVVASTDVKKIEGHYWIHIQNGSENTGITVEEGIRRAENLGAGEIYLTSIDRDGTGFGYDLELADRVGGLTKLPFILSGGVGKFQHFCEGLQHRHVTGASTANIYNFIVDGLTSARAYLRRQDIELAQWDYDLRNLENSCGEAERSEGRITGTQVREFHHEV